jgi:hypothetical protein
VRSLHFAIAGVAACLLADLAQAAEGGIYIGAASGQVETDDTLGLGEVYDDQDSVNSLILGWRPIDWFAVEANYFDLGNVTLTQSQPALAPYRLEQDGWNVFAVFLLELGAFDLYAKGGMVRSSADLTQAVGNSQASSVDTDTDFGWGLGAQVRFRRLATRIEYDEYNISNGDRLDFPKMVSVGITWTF